MKYPSRGDWASTCISDLNKLQITLTLDEIKVMTKDKYTRILKSKIESCAFEYLLSKQGTKGKEIIYSHLQMAEYLQPLNNMLTIEQKRDMFSVKNRMVNIPFNFPKNDKKSFCFCGEQETMFHIYNCEVLTQEKQEKSSYNTIFKGNMNQQVEVYKLFKQNLENRDKIMSEIPKPPCDPCDPMLISNG